MLVTVSGIETVTKELQALNASACISSIVEGRVMLVKPELENALGPILVTPSGIVTLCRA